MSSDKMTVEEIFQAYTTSPDKLSSMLSGLSESNFDLVRESGKWTIREIVHHLVDSDAVVTMIILAALGNSGCTYDQSWYPTDNSWFKTLKYAKRPLKNALSLYRANHQMIEKLIHLLPDATERYVIFRWENDPDGSKITVGNLIHSRVHHAQHHMEQIKETRKANGI